MQPKIVRTRRGARVLQAGTVLSEVLARPGPTHTLFDVLAACVAGVAPGPRVALLGFAAGGMVAPLRAMGFVAPLEAVDLSRREARLFREISGRWSATVSIACAEASEWLRGRPGGYDLIVEDLFAPGPGGMEKPDVSRRVLPRLIRRKLGAGGVAVVNTLPVPGMSWRETFAPFAAPYEEVCVVSLDDYENRFLIASDSLGSARGVSARLRGALRSIGSRQASRISVRALSASNAG